MKPNWQKEIEELHVFFENWLSGSIDKTKENYARFERALSQSFHIISPSASLTERTTLLDQLYAAHHSRANIIIWTKNHQLRVESADIIIATYEEWQTFQEQTSSRLSTVIFKKDSSAHNELLWLHVHETWLPEN